MALYVSGIGSLGAQSRPYMTRLRVIVADALANAYITLFYGDAKGMNYNDKLDIISVFRLTTTLKDEGRLIFTDEEGAIALLRRYGLKTFEKGQLFKLAKMAAKDDPILSKTENAGFDSTKGGVGYYVKDAFIQYPQEFVPPSFVETAAGAAEAEAQMKEYEMNQRYGIRTPEIRLLDPRAERTTLHGWRRRR